MKQVDTNGFWNIKNNPISKVGVFPYLGKQIDSSLEPDKVYMVLRPAEELFNHDTLESFNENPVPLVDDHTMIGDEYTPPEQKGIDGVVQNIRQDGDKLVGDISIYSKAMKDKIASGKKDLSMGYFCTYDLEDGEYNGEHYDAIQRNIRSNHVALVDRGRCGSDVRVFDKWCFDCAITDEDLNENKEQEMNVTDADFEESKHPRANNGQFTSKGGGSSGGSASKAEASKGTNTQTNPNSNNSTNPSEKKYPYREYSKEYPDEYMEWRKTPLGTGEYGVYHGIDPDRVKAVVHGARIQETIYRRFEALEGIPQKLRGQIFEHSKEPSELFYAYNSLNTFKKMLEDSFTKNNNYLYDKRDRKEILKGMQNAFKKVNELAESTAKNSKSAKILSKLKSTSEEFNSFLDKCAQKAAERGFNSKEYIDQFKIKNTASDSGVTASTCDAIQSKIEEIRTMIAKEKLSALKELVAMLESDSPAGDAKPCDELPVDEEKKEDIFEEKKEDEEVVKDEAVDKRELIREIGAIAGKGGLSEEDVRTLMQKAEQLAYSDSERSADDEEEEIIEEKIEEKPEEEKKESEDALPQKIFEMLADRDALVNKVKPLIGNFDFSKMTSDQVAKYACDKLDIKSDTPRAALDGYLKGYTKSKMYSIDSAAQHVETTNSQLEKYLKGE